MAEEENITEGPEQKETPETEEIDIEIEQPKSTGGSRGIWFVIVLIIILAALAWYALRAKQQAEERALQEQQVRAQQYQMQEQRIGKQLNEAAEMLDANDVAGTIELLEGTAKGLSILATQAVSNGDTAYATRIRSKITDAKNALAEIKEKQNELVGLVRDKVIAVQKKLGVSPPPKKEVEAAPEEQKTTEAKPTEPVKERPPQPSPPRPPIPTPAPR